MIEDLVLGNIVHNEEYMRKTIPFIKKEYFDQLEHKVTFELIEQFVTKYNKKPSKDALLVHLEEKTNLTQDQFDNTKDYIESLKYDNSNDEKWLLDKTEKFCQDKALYNAVYEAADILGDDHKSRERGSIPKMIQDALGIMFETRLGHDYILDSDRRFDYYHDQEEKLPFGLKYFDLITKGGLYNKSLNIFSGVTGCHGKGTGILLYDGSIKNVEDVTIDDVLVGDDGNPRYINNLIRNKGMMYKIKINETRDEFIVNEDHIISLVNVTTQEIVNISVKDYLNTSNKFKHCNKAYYVKTPVPFSKKNLIIDPYFMGVYLGDGHSHNCAITNGDIEIVNYIEKYISDEFLYITIRKKEYDNCVTINFTDNYYEGFGKRLNRLQQIFKSYGLNISQLDEDRLKCESKFIPNDYKTSSTQDRLEILAGIIDTDGYKMHNNSYSVSTKSEQLAKDIMFIARSLCFGSKIRPKIVKGTTYYNVLITTSPNSADHIPCKVARKKSIPGYTKNKNPLHKAFSLECIGINDYYGFSISGNNLYCLDNFIVTHNTGKSLYMCHFAAHHFLIGKNVLYLTLEMSEEMVGERIDANLLNMPIDQLQNLSKEEYDRKINQVKSKSTGKIVIHEYPTSSAGAAHFRYLINELRLKKNFIPDVIYVDYLNICASSRFKGGNSSDSYGYMKAISEELRGLAVEFDVPLITGVQVNRKGFKNVDMDLDDISDSFGIGFVSDLFLGLINIEDLEQRGQMLIKQLKNRRGDKSKYNKFVIGVDHSRMKLYDVEDAEQSGLEHAGNDGASFDSTSFGNRENKASKAKNFFS